MDSFLTYKTGNHSTPWVDQDEDPGAEDVPMGTVLVNRVLGTILLVILNVSFITNSASILTFLMLVTF